MLKHYYPKFKIKFNTDDNRNISRKTPYLESKRLVEDLNRANIGHNWWVVNQSLVTLNQRDDLFNNKKKMNHFG